MTSVPLELLDNIDNFAQAMKLAWQTEDNVIAVLQNLGTSTLLALLERTPLMSTLATKGSLVSNTLHTSRSKII